MKLYHASPFIIELADVYHSCDHLDFGKGFYLTSLYDQARKYAMRFLLKKQKAYINEYLLDDELSDFKIKTFCSYNEEWLDYVCILNQKIIVHHLHFIKATEITIGGIEDASR